MNEKVSIPVNILNQIFNLKFINCNFGDFTTLFLKGIRMVCEI